MKTYIRKLIILSLLFSLSLGQLAPNLLAQTEERGIENLEESEEVEAAEEAVEEEAVEEEVVEEEVVEEEAEDDEKEPEEIDEEFDKTEEKVELEKEESEEKLASEDESENTQKSSIPDIPKEFEGQEELVDPRDYFEFNGEYNEKKGYIHLTGSEKSKNKRKSFIRGKKVGEGEENSPQRQTVDLNKAFNLSFYVYLGDASKEWVADGIAIVFHNNIEYEGGIAGAGMGAYSKDLGKAHILEFDTYYNTEGNSNKNKGINDGDNDIKGGKINIGEANKDSNKVNDIGHIAIRSSGKANKENSNFLSDHILLMDRNKDNLLANGEWQKVEYNWDPQANNNKGKISGSIGENKFEKEYNLREDLENPQRAYWAITASTGDAETNQGIFFTKIEASINNVNIRKVDEKKNHLEGAEFKLKKQVEDGSYIDYIPKGLEESEVLKTDKDGLIVLKLENGKYRLREIKAPEGYEIVDKYKEFTVSEYKELEAEEKSILIEVVNKKKEVKEPEKVEKPEKVEEPEEEVKEPEEEVKEPEEEVKEPEEEVKEPEEEVKEPEKEVEKPEEEVKEPEEEVKEPEEEVKEPEEEVEEPEEEVEEPEEEVEEPEEEVKEPEEEVKEPEEEVKEPEEEVKEPEKEVKESKKEGKLPRTGLKDYKRGYFLGIFLVGLGLILSRKKK